MTISNKSCTPCKGGIPPLNEKNARAMLRQTPLWQLVDDGRKIYREFLFNNFLSALAFVNKVGEIAELEQHHPDIEFGWGYARIYIQTHKINGLHENDFILAGKIDLIK